MTVSPGADCMVKLWTVKTNECIATYDQHEEKVLKFYVNLYHFLVKEHYIISTLKDPIVLS